MNLQEDEFYHLRVVKDFAKFKQISDVIVANRLTFAIRDVEDKVYPGATVRKTPTSKHRDYKSCLSGSNGR